MDRFSEIETVGRGLPSWRRLLQVYVQWGLLCLWLLLIIRQRWLHGFFWTGVVLFPPGIPTRWTETVGVEKRSGVVRWERWLRVKLERELLVMRMDLSSKSVGSLELIGKSIRSEKERR
ncbi:hypothetical protein CRG98_007552 [Punica granatum]|uniref:Uncharacterized protein n=1 Tax=Punica granatum TaxID=22663 RepID=A0A2I0KU93_PUNGR|nr:hypothetical protein CRG98_007552 [Punica granatum]